MFFSAAESRGAGGSRDAVALGTPFALRWLVAGIAHVSYRLPGWCRFRGLAAAIGQAA